MNTSNDAYKGMAQSGLLRKTQTAVMAVLKERGDMTSGEIAQALDRRINSVSPRLAELRKLGVVKATRPRPCQVTRQTCLAWVLTGQEPRRSMGDTLLRLRLPGAESEAVQRELRGHQRHFRRLCQAWLEQGARNWLKLRADNRETSRGSASETGHGEGAFPGSSS